MSARATLIGAVATIALALASGVLAASPPDAFERSVKAGLQDSHDRGVIAPTTVGTVPDAFERHVGAVHGSQPTSAPLADVHDRQPAPQQPIAVVSSGGFDWRDATIGAISGIGLGLLLGGLTLLALGLRSRTRMAVR